MHNNVSLSLRACGVGMDAACAWLPAPGASFRGASGCDVMSAAVSARPFNPFPTPGYVSRRRIAHRRADPSSAAQGRCAVSRGSPGRFSRSIRTCPGRGQHVRCGARAPGGHTLRGLLRQRRRTYTPGRKSCHGTRKAPRWLATPKVMTKHRLRCPQASGVAFGVRLTGGVSAAASSAPTWDVDPLTEN